MKLVELSNFQFKVTDEALLVGPFRKLFTMDSSDEKSNFYQQMSIVFFLKDPRSNYNYIVDEKDRLQAILKQEGLPSNYKITKELKSAIDTYAELCYTTSAILLEDTREAIQKIRMALKSVEFDNLDEKDRVNAIKTITATIKEIPNLVKSVSEAEKALNKEIEDARLKGNSDISVGDLGLAM